MIALIMNILFVAFNDTKILNDSATCTIIARDEFNRTVSVRSASTIRHTHVKYQQLIANPNWHLKCPFVSKLSLSITNNWTNINYDLKQCN